MKKLIATTAIAAAAVVTSASGAAAGGPTCANAFDTGWKNHGEHVLGYVNSEDGAAGGAPAHDHGHDHDGPSFAPGASFCLDQANSPGDHI